MLESSLLHSGNFMLKSGGQENEGPRPANKVPRWEVCAQRGPTRPRLVCTSNTAGTFIIRTHIVSLQSLCSLCFRNTRQKLTVVFLIRTWKGCNELMSLSCHILQLDLYNSHFGYCISVIFLSTQNLNSRLWLQQRLP